MTSGYPQPIPQLEHASLNAFSLGMVLIVPRGVQLWIGSNQVAARSAHWSGLQICSLAPLTSFKFVLSPRCALDGAWREFNMEGKLTPCGARILHPGNATSNGRAKNPCRAGGNRWVFE